MPLDLHSVHDKAQHISRSDWALLWQRHAEGHGVPFPLPDYPRTEIQKLTNNLSGAPTMAAAAKFYDIVDEEVRARMATTPTNQLRLLDYGAGWGRITRLFLRSFSPDNISAVDVDSRLVLAGGELLPGIDFRLIESGGTLPYSDGTFDVVVANSVFSHLGEDLHLSTLKELSRVIKPGGVFLGTTLSSSHYEAWLADEGTRLWISGILGDEEKVRAELLAGRFVFGPTGRWPDYGIAILPERWALKNWPRAHFQIIATRTDYSQVVHIARPQSRGPHMERSVTSDA